MKITHIPYCGFECEYPKGSPVIRSISDITNDTLTFEFASGESRSFAFPKWFDSAYNKQFGISVSKDGQRFFAQSWEKGLFCYSLETCELLWHYKRKHAGQIILNDDKLVCFFTDWGAGSFSICDGTFIGRYPFTCNMYLSVKVVDETHMMIGPKRGFHIIIDLDLNELYRIPVSVLDPENHYSFIIQKAEMQDGLLSISGVEFTEEERPPHLKGDLEKYSFKRSIDLSEFV